MSDDDEEGYRLLAEQAHALLKLRAALEEVRRSFDAGDDDWQYRALRTFRKYLQALGFNRPLVDPIQVMLMAEEDRVRRTRRRANGEGGTPKPMGATGAVAFSGAAVSYLKEKQEFSLGQAVKAVSRASGIAEGEIRTFRNRLSSSRRRGGRNQVPKGAKDAHDEAAREFRDHEYSADDVLAFVSGIGRFID